jgi:probable F420-dependent oxidoreductase
MKIDLVLSPDFPQRVPAAARAAEALGFDGVWTNETQHDPFLPLALVAEHTQRVDFGTAIAVSFARSPTTLAYTAWDLAAQSGGRFILGLGTQVRAHIVRRFGMPWPESVSGLLREQIGALRAIWRTWATGEPLNFRGEHLRLTLMTPFFTPPPMAHPEIPIFIAGVNEALCHLAGEVADGFFVHPLHTLRYLREVLHPALALGRQRARREASHMQVVVTAFAHTSPEEKSFVRQQIAFYGSTRSYRPVMALHGWGEVADRLARLAPRGAWAEMGELISDEMLATFSVESAPEDLGAALAQRYSGSADRVLLYLPFSPDGESRFWSQLVSGVRGTRGG